MNKRVLVALGLVVVLVVGLSTLMPDAVKRPQVGEIAKEIALPNLAGVIQGLPKGKVVVLNFWATWCPPCRKEVPSMVRLYNTYKDQGLEIVAVSVDRSKSDVVAFVKEQHMNFTVLHDQDSAVSAQFGVFRYPETFIIGKDGKILKHLNGAVEWMDSSFTDYFEKILKNPT